MKARLALAIALACLAGLGCEPSAAPVDAALRQDVGPLCGSDDECDDGSFCNGAERCAPGPTSDGRGCVAMRSPCAEGQICDETRAHCVTQCAVTRDADGDGHEAAECGGDDCADEDATRYPGNDEVCDPTSHDEDCDSSSFGVRDSDGDGAADRVCCNVDDTGSAVCGTDCDDSQPTRNPTAPEVCDNVDNDCDGALDEGVLMAFYPDADGDLYGDEDSLPRTGCTQPPMFASNDRDCDDTEPTVHPGVVPVCDDVDEACVGTIDLGCPTSVSFGETTSSPALGSTGGTGGTGFREACPAGSAIVGIDMRLSACLDLGAHAGSFRVQCAPLTMNRSSATPYEYTLDFGTVSARPERGCTTGSAFVTARCGEHGAVTRLSGRWGGGGAAAYFGPVSVDCSALALPDVRGTFFLERSAPMLAASSGGEGYTNPFDFTCPEGSVATGLSGNISSGEVRSLVLECTALTLAVIEPAT